MNRAINLKRIPVFLFICITLLSGCQKKDAGKESVASIIPVEVRKVELQDIYNTLEYSGNIKAQDEALVYSKVSGKVLKKVKEDGNLIEKGEPIVYIDRDEVGLKFENAPVESPLKGVVGRIFVDIGAQVTPLVPIGLVVDMDKVKINLDIPEKYSSLVSLGQEAKVRVDAYPDKEFTGKVTKVSPVVEISSRSFPVEITLDNPKHLLNSGMFARVKLQVESRKGVPVILKEAVMGNPPDSYVFIAENNRAILRKVSLGIRQGQFYEVKEGLKVNDLVVIMGHQRLSEGVNIRVEGEK